MNAYDKSIRDVCSRCDELVQDLTESRCLNTHASNASAEFESDCRILQQKLLSLSTQLSRILSFVDHGSHEAGDAGKEIWGQVKKDISNVCCLLMASLRTSHVLHINRKEVDHMHHRLRSTVDSVLEEWSNDFLDGEFQVDRHDAWLAYASLLRSLSPFGDVSECRLALQSQFTRNIKPGVGERKAEALARASKRRKTVDQTDLGDEDDVDLADWERVHPYFRAQRAQRAQNTTAPVETSPMASAPVEKETLVTALRDFLRATEEQNSV